MYRGLTRRVVSCNNFSTHALYIQSTQCRSIWLYDRNFSTDALRSNSFGTHVLGITSVGTHACKTNNLVHMYWGTIVLVHKYSSTTVFGTQVLKYNSFWYTCTQGWDLDILSIWTIFAVYMHCISLNKRLRTEYLTGIARLLLIAPRDPLGVRNHI